MKHHHPRIPGISWSQIRGFNYQPSWGSSGLDLWHRFDAALMDVELGRGRRYFPGINAIRLWLSHDAWGRDPQRFAAHFEQALALAAKHGLAVMPCLFNRWHDPVLDYGGVCLDHFLPRGGWSQWGDTPAEFTRAVVGAHAGDERIFAWDLCNEPYAYKGSWDECQDYIRAETAWLKRIADIVRDQGATAPVTVGVHAGYGVANLAEVEPFCDLITIHPYWRPGDVLDEYRKGLDDALAFAAQVGKPVLVTECCWGSTDDAQRAQIIRVTLQELKQRHLGWLAYLLHHSLIADAHREQFGHMGGPGNLSFIEADGSLRPGHEVFNDY